MFIDRAQIGDLQMGIVANGVALGEGAEQMSRVNYDPGLMRPWIDEDGQRYLDVRTGRMVKNKEGEKVHELDVVPLRTMVGNGIVPAAYNATALEKDVWERIDRKVIKASRDRLRAYADLRSAETFGGFDGMGITALIRDTMTDPGDASIDMDGLSEPQADRPIYAPDILPLPVTHCGFFLSQRQLASSRNSGTPLDTTLAESCGRRVGEAIEKMTIGTLDLSTLLMGTAAQYTNRGIYGYVTQPDRMTKTDITGSGTATPVTFKNEVLAMRALAYAKKFYGPFILYHSTSWDSLLDDDYVTGTSAQGLTTVNKTVRQRIEMINGITAVRRLDFLPTVAGSDVLLLVQMTSDTVRAVSGMDLTTVQWETNGGLKTNFQVMAIQVPDLRSQFIGQGVDVDARVCGIVHGTTS